MLVCGSIIYHFISSGLVQGLSIDINLKRTQHTEVRPDTTITPAVSGV